MSAVEPRKPEKGMTVPPDGKTPVRAPVRASAGQFNVAAALHPLKTEVVDLVFDEGLTIKELLEEAGVGPNIMSNAHVFIGDYLVPQEMWENVRPKAGSLVSVRMGMAGGKNPLRTILTLAVLVASAGLGGVVGGALGLSGQLAQGVGSALILVGGTILVNAIAPLPGPGNDDQTRSPTYFLDAARNALRPYDPIPVVMGRHRHVPPLGAQVYTEVVGDVNHLRLLVVWGYGPLKIEDIRIGETPIDDFEDIRIETREGRPGEAPITLYPGDVNQENLGITMTKDAGWISRRSARDADELSVDVTLPTGLSRYNDKGERVAHEVEIQIQYREVGGTGEWLTPDISDRSVVTATTFAPAWFAHAGNAGRAGYGKITIKGSRTETIRHGYRWTVPSRAQYDVRLRRISEDATEDRIFDTIQWSVLRTFTDRNPIATTIPLAVTALDIRATDQLNRVVDQLNAIVTSEVPDWNGADWVDSLTSNPAALFRHALQGPNRSNPTPDSEIDLDQLQYWSEFARRNNYEYNAVIDYKQSMWNQLVQIAAVARASPDWVDGKWTVVVDDGEQITRQHFTPRNTSNFSMKKQFQKEAHAYRVTFKNRNEDWGIDERTVYADNYDETNAQIFYTIEAPGITDPDHIWKYARTHMAQVKLRPEVWTQNVDAEYLVARRGSKALITQDVLSIGQASSRIKSIDAGPPVMVTLDEEVTMEAGTDYGITVRTPDDAGVRSRVVTDAGTTKTLELMNPPSDFTTKAAAGDLMAFGEFESESAEALVTAINPGGNLSASVTLLPYAADMYDAETGTIPDYETHITRRIMLPDLVVTQVTSDESAIDTIARRLDPRIVVGVVPIDFAGAYMDVQLRARGTEEPWANAAIRVQAPEFVIIGDVAENQRYDIRLRWNSTEELIPGRWTVTGNHLVGTYPVGGVGEDGTTFEFVFTSSEDGTMITGNSNLPDPEWNYQHTGIDTGITRGDHTYTSGTPSDLDKDRPYSIRFRRPIEGSPEANEDIGEVEWTQESAVRAVGSDAIYFTIEEGLPFVDLFETGGTLSGTSTQTRTVIFMCGNQEIARRAATATYASGAVNVVVGAGTGEATTYTITGNDSENVTVEIEHDASEVSAHLAFRLTEIPTAPTPDGIDTNVSTLRILEADEGTLQVRILGDITDDVIVEITTDDDEIDLPSQRFLTFTEDNKMTFQEYEIEAPADTDTTDATAVVTLTATGGLSETKLIPVQIPDRGDADFYLESNALTGSIGDTVTIRYGLTAPPSPTGRVTVVASEHSGSARILSPAVTNFFYNLNWDLEIEVEVEVESTAQAVIRLTVTRDITETHDVTIN